MLYIRTVIEVYRRANPDRVEPVPGWANSLHRMQVIRGLVSLRATTGDLRVRPPFGFHNDAENGCRFWTPQDADHSGKRIIVCGGRDFLDAAAVEKALRFAHGKRRIGVLVHGAEPGVDTVASGWARR